MIPVYGFLDGDTIGLLVLLDGADTIAEATEKLVAAADVRAAAPARPVFVHRERVLPPTMTVAAAGIEALDRVDVREAFAGEGP